MVILYSYTLIFFKRISLNISENQTIKKPETVYDGARTLSYAFEIRVFLFWIQFFFLNYSIFASTNRVFSLTSITVCAADFKKTLPSVPTVSDFFNFTIIFQDIYSSLFSKNYMYNSFFN